MEYDRRSFVNEFHQSTRIDDIHGTFNIRITKSFELLNANVTFYFMQGMLQYSSSSAPTKLLQILLVIYNDTDGDN